MTDPFSSDEIAQTGKALLADLEASLDDSHQALLSRDFARLEQCTREQIASHRALEILGPQSPCDPASFAALRAAQVRVLEAARVQAALLGRAQRWLRTLANLVAGPEANYSAPVCNGQGAHFTPTDLATRVTREDEDHQAQERNQCPA